MATTIILHDFLKNIFLANLKNLSELTFRISEGIFRDPTCEFNYGRLVF
jgi:hypothetical protein